MWFVYVVRCADQSLYTGVTTDAGRRIDEHNDGSGARYTRARGPVELVYLERVKDRGSALRREHEIKRMTAAGKRAMVESARRKKARRKAHAQAQRAAETTTRRS